MAFPTIQADINAILQLWKNRIAAYETQYGLTTDQIRQISDDADVYSHLLNARSQLNEDVSEFSVYFTNITNGDRNLPAAAYPTVSIPPLPTLQLGVKPGIVSRNTEIYNYLKKHPNRTAESLADLGITETSVAPIAPETLKPSISGATLPDDKVSITFNKQRMASIRVQMRRGGEWINVGDPTTSPFIDATKSLDDKPEKREYRAIYLVKNQPVGQYSDIITIYTTP